MTGIAWPGERTDFEMGHLLERNGYLAPGADLFAGADPRPALSQYAGREPLYDDSEGRWLQEWVDELAREGC